MENFCYFYIYRRQAKTLVVSSLFNFLQWIPAPFYILNRQTKSIKHAIVVFRTFFYVSSIFILPVFFYHLQWFFVKLLSQVIANMELGEKNGQVNRTLPKKNNAIGSYLLFWHKLLWKPLLIKIKKKKSIDRQQQMTMRYLWFYDSIVFHAI